MKKWIVLGLITVSLIMLESIEIFSHVFHEAYQLIVLFFAAQTFILLRIDLLISAEWKVQASLIKIVVRFITSAVFILIAIYQYENPYHLVIQFILVYLVYMIFEIVLSLTNLRRN